MGKDLPPFLDLKGLSENQRCRLIAETCAQNPDKQIGVFVDNEEKIIVRYIRKIKERNPLVTVERVGIFEDAKDGFFLRAFQPQHGTS